MSKTMSDRYPQELRDLVRNTPGCNGLADYSLHIGLTRNRLTSVFGGKKSHLRPYYNFAQYSGITMEKLAGLMMTGEIGPFIEKLAKKEEISIQQLEIKAGVGDGFLQKRIKGGMHLNGLARYIEVAHAMKWTLDHFTEVCLKSP